MGARQAEASACCVPCWAALRGEGQSAAPCQPLSFQPRLRATDMHTTPQPLFCPRHARSFPRLPRLLRPRSPWVVSNCLMPNLETCELESAAVVHTGVRGCVGRSEAGPVVLARARRSAAPGCLERCDQRRPSPLGHCACRKPRTSCGVRRR